MMPVRSPQDIVAKNLSSTRGYPLWYPEQGLRIGDVGVVHPAQGSFDCFFNLCLPGDQQHRTKGAPEGFNHIELSDRDVTTIRDAEPPGCAITSASVTNVRIREQPASGDRAGATKYEFDVSSSEGAILILPDGAERQEVKDPRPFFEQAAKHAAAWYRFGKKDLGRMISHESLYVITGLTKARTWSIAGFGEGQGETTGCFTFAPQNRGGHGSTYNLNSSGPRSLQSRFGDESELANQTVFIHGFKVAVRSAVRGLPQRWSHLVPHPEGGSWFANAWKGISRTIGLSDEDSHERMSYQVEISSIPEILPVFHPGETINQYLLYQREPSATVAITHDSFWSSLLQEGLIQPEHLAEAEHLEAAISKHYTIVLRNSVVYLQRKPKSILKRSPAPSQAATAESIDKDTEHPKSVNVVSSSNYRCPDDRATTSEIPPEDLLSLSSSFTDSVSSALPASREPLRVIKIMILSDYLCSFCYLMDKVVHEAIEACQNLPVRFEVESRPFTLLSPSAANSNKGMSRNAYIIKKFGKEQAEVKLKAVSELAQQAGLKLAEDGIICRTIQAQRLSMKAYQIGGQRMQRGFNTLIYKACLAEGKDVSDEDLLASAAAEASVMPKEEAMEYLRSTKDLDRVEKMIEAAKAQGVSGVPFVIVDGKWAVNGVQPAECFIQIFRKLAHSPGSSTPSR